MLEARADALEAGVLEDWRGRVARAQRHLGWTNAASVIRQHRAGVSLALSAPCDQLYTATEVNEWALCASLAGRNPIRWQWLEQALAQSQPDVGEPAVLEQSAALARLTRIASAASRPALRAIVEAARRREMPVVLDDETLTLGIGAGSRSWLLAAVPDRSDEIPWAQLHAVPTALVTGSNGKTTTVRLIAACAEAHGLASGYSCTDGVFVGGEQLEAGDYSGPVGARTVLRNPGVEAAVLETARGGILRRGLATSSAEVAIVTNVSADHFGEYGIDDLAALAQAKLVVRHALGPKGLLVLNADDRTLVACSAAVDSTIGWFALDADEPRLAAHRERGGAVCGVREGRLQASFAGTEFDLGAITAMPLSVTGSATYNVANLAGAALCALAFGVPARTIAAVYASFGGRVEDNLGRLMRLELGGVQILLDYAHNPAGLSGILEVAGHLRKRGRLGLLLGHAGNRADEDLQKLASVAAAADPDLVVVKEIDGYRRGRREGEVAGILRAALLGGGLTESATPVRLLELEAARYALEWARPGDLLVLLVHSLAARAAVTELLQRLHSGRWQAGQPLPAE